MTSVENSPAGTSSLRRWWSIAIGVTIFVGLLLVYQVLLSRVLGPDTTDHLTSGFALLEVVGGFVCGYVGAACGRLVARDMDKKMFLYSATAVLVVVVLIVVALISASPVGFTLGVAITALALVIPAFIGLKAGTQ